MLLADLQIFSTIFIMKKVQKEHAPRSHSSRSSDQENCGFKADHLGQFPSKMCDAYTVNPVSLGCVYADGSTGEPELPINCNTHPC